MSKPSILKMAIESQAVFYATGTCAGFSSFTHNRRRIWWGVENGWVIATRHPEKYGEGPVKMPVGWFSNQKRADRLFRKMVRRFDEAEIKAGRSNGSSYIIAGVSYPAIYDWENI